ncbi:hypothetical protein RJT34_16869 [Clitoria ternatea]|uniref:Uncharacterized protein n=1 Tax=Clitoria ternatea TaxID=43366 RepID=A0AAN9J9H6_CLITE
MGHYDGIARRRSEGQSVVKYSGTWNWGVEMKMVNFRNLNFTYFEEIDEYGGGPETPEAWNRVPEKPFQVRPTTGSGCKPLAVVVNVSMPHFRIKDQLQDKTLHWLWLQTTSRGCKPWTVVSSVCIPKFRKTKVLQGKTCH